MIFRLKKQIEEILKDKEDKNFEADIIISTITKLKKKDWLLKKDITLKEVKACLKLSKKRQKGIPLQYLIKNWEFYGIPIKVGKGVLIPRQETEIVVDILLKLIKKDEKILDLGAGSGCISKAIAKNKKNVTIVAVEKYNKAIKYTKKNLKDLDNVEIVKGNILDEKLAKKFKEVDLIVSNPPYLTENDMRNLQKEVGFEPKSALFGGKDGLKYYEIISSIWKDSLKKGGYLVFEIGFLQKDSVERILEKNSFKEIKTYKDLEKKDRVVVGKK